jgi:OCT family organic cation transporter-like MFS transporter 4/5
MYEYEMFRLIPESPRWLLRKGRIQEAEVIIRRVAQVNKATLPDELFDKEDEQVVQQEPIWKLFASWNMCIRTLIVLFNWYVCMLMRALFKN